VLPVRAILKLRESDNNHEKAKTAMKRRKNSKERKRKKSPFELIDARIAQLKDLRGEEPRRRHSACHRANEKRDRSGIDQLAETEQGTK
jgi:hypothetical protein